MHPVLLEWGSVTLYSYGLFVALAVGAAFLYTQKRAPSGVGGDLLFILFIGGIVGARLFYVLQHWGDYAGRSLRIFWIAEGGLVWYGGFLGAILAGGFYAKIKRESVWKWADFFSPVLPLSQGIGRAGCYLNGCCYGKFWADGVTRHPVQLYEMALLFLLALFLFLVSFRKRREGAVFATYLAGYGLIRFFTEFFRGDQAAFAGLTIPQWMSLALILWALFLFKKCRLSA